MIKKISEFKEYQNCLKELENAKAELKEKEINFGKIDAIAKNLAITLGINEAGEKINWNKIREAEENSKIAKREMDFANEKVLKAEENLKETIEKIRLIRIKEAKAEGLKLNKKVIEIFRSIEKCKELYSTLERELKSDFKEIKIKGGFSSILGSDPRYILGLINPYITYDFVKNSRKYQGKKEIIK